MMLSRLIEPEKYKQLTMMMTMCPTSLVPSAVTMKPDLRPRLTANIAPLWQSESPTLQSNAMARANLTTKCPIYL